MTLTLGTGPLGRGGGDANYTFDGPAHRILFQPYQRRLRAIVGGEVVLDTTRAHLLHETGIAPVAYAPMEDFTAPLTATQTTTHCPFKGDATYWTLRAGDREIADAVWGYEQPLERAPWLLGFGALYWEKADEWLVEEEPVLGHLRDPYHRVDVHESSRLAQVRAGGAVLVSSPRPKLVFETGLPARAYLPRGDVPPGVLEASETTSVCPYKGIASYWHVHAGGRRHEDGAFSYETPLPEALRAAGHVSFMADGLEVVLAD